MTDISTETIIKSIKAVLKDADLDQLSAKKIRKQLEVEFKADFTERKGEIDKLVMQLITDNDSEEEKEEEKKEVAQTKPKTANGSSAAPKRAASPAKKGKAKNDAQDDKHLSNDEGGDDIDDIEEQDDDDDSDVGEIEDIVPKKKAKAQPASKKVKSAKKQPVVRKQKKPRKESAKDYFANSGEETFVEESSSEEENENKPPGQEDGNSGEAEDNFSLINTDIDQKAVEKPCFFEFAENAGKVDKKCQLPFTCNCKYNTGTPCSLLFTPVQLQDLRANHQSHSKDELDLIVLSQIQAGIHDNETTQRPKQNSQTERIRVGVDYFHKGHKICRDTFMYIHGIFKDRLTTLISHYQEHGVVHGNNNRSPHNAPTFEQRLDVVRFISNFAEQHAILLPGRIPGYARDDLKLLPSSCTKASVYDTYVQSCIATRTERMVCQSVFLTLWRECLPEVLPMKPSTDLCWTCQRNSMFFFSQACNIPEEENLKRMEKARQHLTHATTERAYYRTVVQNAKDAVTMQQPCARLLKPGHNVPDCGVDFTTHYSFDFAQQVHYPSNPQQPGPIYFKTPGKCGVFGVMAEAIPQMALFLLDEAVETGKGVNTVISMLDFFFQNLGLKETEVHLHADNCAGQNKDNAMMQYLLWRVMTKRHRKITLSFLVDGHTQFSPDWCFGLFKRTFRRTKVDCLEDIVNVAQQASASGIFVPQLCGTEDGSPLVPVRNWSGFLDTWFSKLVGLKKFHHFTFFESGDVHVKLTCDSDHKVRNLLKSEEVPPKKQIAPIITPGSIFCVELGDQYKNYD